MFRVDPETENRFLPQYPLLILTGTGVTGVSDPKIWIGAFGTALVPHYVQWMPPVAPAPPPASSDVCAEDAAVVERAVAKLPEEVRLSVLAAFAELALAFTEELDAAHEQESK